MTFAREAFIELFPYKDIDSYTFRISYTDRFKPFNANVKYTRNSYHFFLSKKWCTISKEIQKGLIQLLLLKAFRQKGTTTNIDLYNNFMRNVHIAVPKTKTDPVLEESFNRANETYMLGLLERPNLEWHNSTQRLGTYEYGSDTISLSKILLDDLDVLDYVMYHEMLHKHFKFKDGKNGSCRHHTKAFRYREAQFKDSKEMEKRIHGIVRKHKLGRVKLF